jgi:long-chain fatty acid transport protein
MNTPRTPPAPLPAARSPLLPPLLLAALLPASALANGTRLPNQNAEAAARGNAFVATADNPSAIYYNPAGLTQLPGLQIQSDAYAISARYDYESPLGADVKAERDIAVVPQFYASFTPENSAFSYGLGVYSPFGQSSEWPGDSGFRSIATRNEIVFLAVAPTLAWKLSDTLSVGAGLQVNHVEADLASGIFAPGDEFRFRGDDTSFGYNLGILWKPADRHVFGINYQSRSTARLKGGLDLNPLGLEADASVDLVFPDVITLGYSWRPSPAWNLEVAIDRTNWDLVNTPVLRSALIPPAGGRPIPFEWKASYYYLFGVTRSLDAGWRVSAGYSYSENSVPDATFNPAVPDMNRHFASIGVGRDFGALALFLAYQHGFKSTRTVSGSMPNPLTGESADGRYTAVTDAASFSLRYAF